MNETIIASVITALLTYFGTKKQTEYQLKGKQVEADVNTEGMYVKNMSIILAEYKEQVSGFRDELKQVKQEFAAFKDEHYRKINEYEVYTKELEEENEKSKGIIANLKEIIAKLKQEIANLKEQIAILKEDK
ncbi:hypothetical protein SAMN04488100_10517 [Alkalibacterium putridalgicola]|uniref:Uncharacterized protein n=1 Tax=Alkalibacterium putridalgicola TaxID=426703 RepID=A0A1H7RJG2_9LACT|nr:hypothetical protein [Alkalibacterium putridalgicola]GEK88876.1 hypothetical protein APU01nite_09150 [Alkalibacterium putridalgicola]SEL60420.1 hypothetical protein SAMN04488100_10517 [Alkalibacterium putridalgicola]